MIDISKVFNQFAGRTIDVIEKQITWQDVPRTVTTINPADPLVQEIIDAGKAAGFNRVRLLTPDTVTTRDARGDRANVYAEKGTDGKWRIGSNPRIG